MLITGNEIPGENKILIVSSEFPPGPGGIGNHAFNLSFELNKRGHEVVINTISDYVTEDKASVFDEKLPYKVYRFKRYKNTLLTWIFRLSTIKNTIDKYKIKSFYFWKILHLDNSFFKNLWEYKNNYSCSWYRARQECVS